MKQRRHPPEQIIRKLAEGEKLLGQRQGIEEVARRTARTDGSAGSSPSRPGFTDNSYSSHSGWLNNRGPVSAFVSRFWICEQKSASRPQFDSHIQKLRTKWDHLGLFDPPASLCCRNAGPF
jgi:hypothetical protein